MMIQKNEQNIADSDLGTISDRIMNLATEDTELIEDEEDAIDKTFQESQEILHSLAELALKIESEK